MRNLLFYCLVAMILPVIAFTQTNETANDYILPYSGDFRPASNIGYYPPFTEIDLANLGAGNEELNIKGVGVKSFRPFLSEAFMEEYGYDFFLDNFAHYESVGLKENTIIVGFPKESHRDPTFYCPDIRSELFANMYTDIWDNGENGTPVNDENYYALYLYKMVQNYKDYIKFWEIWNEPGFDFSRQFGYLPPNEEGNWWTNNPDPCDYKLRAPIFHYNRLLRISYEIIHTFDPDSYVTVSGVGYASFLDAILRNTDNPIDGSESAEFPLKGGAYFDVIGFHSYPHLDGSLKQWDPLQQDFVYSRHSDAAADGIVNTKNDLQNVLTNYGYDNSTYPEKHWIVTECNIPRKQVSDYVGGDEVQRNFLMKAYVESVKNDFLQLHVYQLAENEDFNVASDEFDVMGLYQKFNYNNLYFQKPTQEGIGFKTASDLLFGKTYDPIRTTDLLLNNDLNGAAFKDNYDNYTYVLWARTTLDQSEEASEIYSFPGSLGLTELLRREWNFSSTTSSSTISSNNITLSSSPTFFTERIFTISNSEICAPAAVEFQSGNILNANSYNWAFEGGIPNASTDVNPNIQYNSSGSFEVKLEVKNSDGQIIASQSDIISVGEIPMVNFEYSISGPIIQLNNLVLGNVNSFNWNFGDGNSSSEANPTHVYSEEGTYSVVLQLTNDCGTEEQSQVVEISVPSDTAPNSTANNAIQEYSEPFKPGTNLGYFGNQWTDEQLADLAAGNVNEAVQGIGAKAIRPFLPENFLETYGYEFRIPAFQHYQNLGLKDNTLIVGFPSEEHREKINYCQSYQSELFAGMYQDIWDDGENGTPVNDENYYALYLYKTANLYKDYVKFWEIWNEPGFDFTGTKGFLEPGVPGNWWDNNPDPCDYKLRAPVTHMVRMLRISYEVIKSVDPDALVTFSGIGFPSFLDAVLRNSDNPLDGSINNTYPLKGGAYFDVVGFHSYPHFDGSLRSYDSEIGAFIYNRHSDAAADGILNAQINFEEVLSNYGYDGNTYPEKHWIITECNIPRKSIGESFGGEEAQINYSIKAYIQSMIGNVLQLHMYQIGESNDLNIATDEFELMGLYQNLSNSSPTNEIKNGEGIAFKTCSDQLYLTDYDAQKTAAMDLPSNLGGAAFKNINGKYNYVLWAKTTEDRIEQITGSYSFPSSFGINELFRKEWNNSETQEVLAINGQNINLSSTPIFLSEELENPSPAIASFTSDVQEACIPFSISFTNTSQNSDSYVWTFPGGEPSSSTELNPVVLYNNPGEYDVILEVENEFGQHISKGLAYISAKGLAEPAFSYVENGFQISFANNSVGATSYEWNFGDGRMSEGHNPTHTYLGFGVYEVSLTAINECGPSTTSQTISILPPFSAELETGCEPFSTSFSNNTSNSVSQEWVFEGGTPSTSSATNPQVEYTEAGIYDVSLEVTDINGNTVQYFENNYIKVDPIPKPSFTINGTLPFIYFVNTSDDATSYLWDFGDGTTSTSINPSHNYNTTSGDITVSLTATNNCGSITVSEVLSVAQAPVVDFTESKTGDCNFVSVYFQDKSTAGPMEWFWVFEGGSPSTSTEPNVVVSYFNSGSFNVSLIARNSIGESRLVKHDHIRVDIDSPTASFTSTVNGTKVNFENTSSMPASFIWEFGDGETSTEIHPIHTYSKPDNYEVRLTATNYCGTVNYQESFTTSPDAQFQSQINQACVPLEVNFLDISTGEVNEREWQFPGGSPSSSTEASPTITYETEGEFEVTLTVQNDAGSSSLTQENHIQVGAIPNATINCRNDQLSYLFFTDPEIYTTVEWDFGDGNNSTEPIINYEYAQTGNYIVTLTKSNPCGSHSTTKEIEVSLKPTAQFFLTGNTACVGKSITFVNEDEASIDSWEWQFPGGTPSISMLQNPTVEYALSGDYPATLIVSNQYGSDTLQMPNFIEVIDNLSIKFDFLIDDNIVQFGLIEDGLQNILWDFGDGFTSTERQPIHTYECSGEHLVTLSGFGLCGQFNSEQQLSISTKPKAYFVSDLYGLCEEGNIQFYDLSSADVDEWNWFFPGGTPSSSTEQDPLIYYEEVGIYPVSLSVTNEAGTTQFMQSDYVNIYEFPTADFEYSAQEIDGVILVSFLNNSSNASTFHWDFGDGWTNDAKEPTHIYEQDGSYEVTLIIENDCGTDTKVISIDIEIVSIEELSFVETVRVYPNPTKGIISVESTDLFNQNLSFKLINILGETVFKKELDINSSGLKQQFDFSTFSKGSYFLHISSKENQSSFKLIIQ